MDGRVQARAGTKRKSETRPALSQDHAMQDVFRRLFVDFFSTIVFLVVYLATDNILIATGVGIAGAIGQFICAQSARQQARPDDAGERRARRRARQRDDAHQRSALRAGEAVDRAFRDRLDHAPPQLDDALHAGDRASERTRPDPCRGLLLGRADVRARRRHCGDRAHGRHEAVDILRHGGAGRRQARGVRASSMSPSAWWSAAASARK